MKIFEGKIFFSWILVIAFFLFLFFLVANKPNFWTSDIQNQKIQYIKIAGKILKIELALTPEAQEKGLSGRKELKENEGMLFVFNHIGQYSFWMKDMNFALDIIWLAPSESGDKNDLRVVYIKKNALPESYLPAGKAGPETFSSSQDAKYVLEVLAQFSEKNNLKVGDRVEFLSP